ncbi:MAG: WD40 repeat domain-containing protein, partial [Rivularia sp. ALOHA_DT_140]|nr:WD40 repeat domain-containing protein [Rivularia sp. ALOHA_DT_140]
SYSLSISFSPDGKIIADGALNGNVRLWDVTTEFKDNIDGRQISNTTNYLKTFTENSAPISSISFSKDGKKIAYGSLDGIVKIRDINTGSLIRKFPGYSRPIHNISFSPNDKYIIYELLDNIAIIQDIYTGDIIKGVQSHSNVSFSPDSGIIAFTPDKDKIKLFDIFNKKEITTLKKQSNNPQNFGIVKIIFSPDVNKVASASKNGNLTLCNLATGREIKTLTNYSTRVSSLRFSPDGNKIAAASRDGKLILWNSTTGRKVKYLQTNSSVKSISYSSDGKFIVSASNDYSINNEKSKFKGKIKLWNSKTGKYIKKFKLNHHSSEKNTANKTKNRNKNNDSITIQDMKLSPNDNIIAFGLSNGTITLLNNNNGKEIKTIQAHSKRVANISFSPDSKMIASSSGEGTIKIWDLKTGKKIKTFTEHSRSVNHVSFSTDGKTIASASGDKTI